MASRWTKSPAVSKFEEWGLNPKEIKELSRYWKLIDGLEQLIREKKEEKEVVKIVKQIPKIKKASQSVAQINLRTNEVIEKFTTAGQASKKTGVALNSIHSACKKIFNQAGGHRWRYIERVKKCAFCNEIKTLRENFRISDSRPAGYAYCRECSGVANALGKVRNGTK